MVVTTGQVDVPILAPHHVPTCIGCAVPEVELRPWAGAEDAGESERKSVRSENNMASRGREDEGGIRTRAGTTALKEHAVAE